MAITHKYTLICDDVRQENTGKFLIIGVYQGVVGVQQIPIGLPNGLTFFQGWDADRPEQVDMKVKIQHLETGQSIIEARAGMQVLRPGHAMLPLKLAPIQFNAYGAYNLVVEVDGQKDPVIIDFIVQLMTMKIPGQGGPTPRI